MYQPRLYRSWVKDKDLVSCNVTVGETDLCVRALSNLRPKALRLVKKYRVSLEGYIARHPWFRTSLEPVAVEADAPRIVTAMAAAAQKAGVGPMAAVAGAIAEFVGSELLPFAPELIIENGGDIFLSSALKRRIGIYAGGSRLSGRIALETGGSGRPLGICTSSGTVGPSLSRGRADAAVVLSPSVTLADAAATAVGNLVVHPADITLGIERAQAIEGVSGVIIIKDDRMGAWGQVEICPMSLEEGALC